MLIAGAALLTLSNLWMMQRADLSDGYWTTLFPGLVGMGLAMGMLFAPLNAAALIEIDRVDYAVGSATFSTGRYLAGAIGIASVVAVIGDGQDSNPIRPFERAYLLFVALGVISFTVLALAWPKREQWRDQRRTTA
jgi:hypothetical protein